MGKEKMNDIPGRGGSNPEDQPKLRANDIEKFLQTICHLSTLYKNQPGCPNDACPYVLSYTCPN